MNRIPPMHELDPIRPELAKWVERTAQMMDRSKICLTIFTENYKNGIDSLLQLSLAMMLDKPIYLLVPEGVKVPEHVKKIASAIEFYQRGNRPSMDAGLSRLLATAKEKGFAE